MVSFEEAYSWLNELDDNIYLRVPVQQIIGNMKNSLEHRDYSRVNHLLKLSTQVSKSIGNTPNDLSRAETYLECARAYYIMGDFSRAVTEFRQSASLYLMGGHQHNESIARWLLGCALWRCSKQGDAIVEWEKSCQLFKQLRITDEAAIRYDPKIFQMEQTLQRAINSDGWDG